VASTQEQAAVRAKAAKGAKKQAKSMNPFFAPFAVFARHFQNVEA
jgi:hypothetical protein